MRVLIGITSKNRAEILPKAITSALSQTYANKEVWVFDDASTDNTRSLAQKFPNVHWIFSEEPKGYVYARNLLMSKSGFDLYCSLDDDSWFINDNSLEEGIEILRKDHSIGALGFDMLSPDDPEATKEKPYLKISNNFIGCGHIIRLTAAKEINYYTPNPGFYGTEEKDLSIRLMDKGYKVMFLKGVYVWHDKTSVSRNMFNQHRSGVCNDLVFTYRRSPVLFLMPTLLYKIYKHLVFAFKNKCLHPTTVGFKDFIRWLFTAKKNRNPVSVKGFIQFLQVK